MPLLGGFSGKLGEKRHVPGAPTRARQRGAAEEEPDLHLPAAGEKALVARTATPHVLGHSLIIMINIYMTDGLLLQCRYLANEGDGTTVGTLIWPVAKSLHCSLCGGGNFPAWPNRSS